MNWWPLLGVLLVFVEGGIIPGYSFLYWIVLFALFGISMGGYAWFNAATLNTMVEYDTPVVLTWLDKHHLIRIPFFVLLGPLVYENEKFKKWYLKYATYRAGYD